MRKLVVLLALVAACSGASPPLAIVANSDLAVGPQRVLLGLRSPEDGAALEKPGRLVEVEFYAPADFERPIATQGADFIWLVPDVRGVYVTTFDFPEPGLWGTQLKISDLPDTGVTPFQVFEEALTPNVGDVAPPSASLTLDDAPLEILTSDPAPDPRFYELSLDEALASGRPTVVVFATPAFCQTATCGPTLETVKGMADAYPAIDFVHIEVFDLTRTPDELVTVDAVNEWQLPSEPWVFIVDGSGVVTSRFEGVASQPELTAALREVTQGGN